MRALLLCFLWIIFAQPARAGLNQRELDAVGVTPPLNAAVPLALTFRDLAGRPTTLGDAIAYRPALLFLVDFTCRTICGPELAIASGALGAAAGLRPGMDYSLIVVGLDPNDTSEDAKGILAQVGDPAVLAATTVLAGSAGAIRTLTASIGYRFAYDEEHDQFAHPAAGIVVSPDGRLSRVLSGLALNAFDLRLAIVEAAHGKAGSLTDRLTVLCYGFDAVHGVYTLLVWRVLELGGGATITVLLASILFFNRRRRQLSSRRSE